MKSENFRADTDPTRDPSKSWAAWAEWAIHRRQEIEEAGFTREEAMQLLVAHVGPVAPTYAPEFIEYLSKSSRLIERSLEQE